MKIIFIKDLEKKTENVHETTDRFFLCVPPWLFWNFKLCFEDIFWKFKIFDEKTALEIKFCHISDLVFPFICYLNDYEWMNLWRSEIFKTMNVHLQPWVTSKTRKHHIHHSGLPDSSKIKQKNLTRRIFEKLMNVAQYIIQKLPVYI